MSQQINRRHPEAYLLTWTTYGTRLPGDPRGSVARWRNLPNAPLRAPNVKLRRLAQENMRQPPMFLSAEMRTVVRKAIVGLSSFRDWQLHAVNVRTNHVHVVVTAQQKPGLIVAQMKSSATRSLRGGGLCGLNERVWTRHGSTRYLFEGESVVRAVNYVKYFQ